MTHDADQLLVNELVEIVQQRDGNPVPVRRTRERPPRNRRLSDIVLWSSVTNLTLLACFFAGWNFETIKGYFLPPPVAQALAARAENPLTDSRRELQDNELLTRGPQRQLKGPLQFTMVPSTPSPEQAEAASAAPLDVQPEAVAAVDDPSAQQDQGDGSGEMTVGPEDPAAQLVKSPVLRRAQKPGEVEIGSFTTVSLPGASSECLDTAYALLDDAGASRDKLKVLAESKLITVARICADNGTLVVTCRSDQITISPRRSKPNETCTG